MFLQYLPANFLLYGLNEKSGIEIEESEPECSDEYPVLSAIGQGTNNYTTVQLARYVSAIANNGTVYQLSLIEKIDSSTGVNLYSYEPNVRNKVEISNELWNAVHLGMRRVIEGKSYFRDFPITSAGKTGTAQESANKANHALFVGYAPYDHPEITLAVRIANGYTSDNAAKIDSMYEEYMELSEQEEE